VVAAPFYLALEIKPNFALITWLSDIKPKNLTNLYLLKAIIGACQVLNINIFESRQEAGGDNYSKAWSWFSSGLLIKEGVKVLKGPARLQVLQALIQDITKTNKYSQHNEFKGIHFLLPPNQP
jgi:hypothetical protein